jgi:hypothetical protein
MGKIVFWLIVFFVVLLVLRLVNAANSRAANGKAPGGRNDTKHTAMARCVNCGVYLPRSDAVDGPRGPVCGDPQCLPREKRKRG